MTDAEREVAWAAGLFEGEGSIHTNGVNGRIYLYLNLSSTDQDVVRRFAKAISCGKVYGPYDPGNGNKPRYSWHAKSKSDSEIALSLLEPYLCERRRSKLAQVRVLVAGQPPPQRSGWKLSKEHRQKQSENMKRIWAERKQERQANGQFG